MQDIIFIFQWWAVFLGIGVIFLPLTSLIFRNFWDYGYVFAKVLGYTILSYIVFLVGILHILKFNNFTIYFFIWIFLLINIFIGTRFFVRRSRTQNDKEWKELKSKLPIFIFEELMFLIALIFWSFVRSHEPSIHGLEKYMDFGFVNSILRAEYFPPKDMWFTPFSINYYYFGHLITAVLTKLSGIPSNITYNLMLSTIFALTFTGAFSIGANLVHLFKINKTRGGMDGRVPDNTQSFDPAKPEKLRTSIGGKEIHDRTPSNKIKKIFVSDLSAIKTALAGFLTAFLVTLAGNLHTIYTLFKPYVNEKPQPIWELGFSLNTFPNSYWYPNATRFIYNTIHEFPIYSFVVSDLHGHVLDIPIVLLTIAILLSLISKSQTTTQIQNSKFKVQNYNSKFKIKKLLPFDFCLLTLLLVFLLAVMYMTNVWDGIIYFMLAGIVLLYLTFIKSFSYVSEDLKSQKSNLKSTTQNSKLFKNLKLKIKNFLILISILGFGFIIFTLPFSLTFKPFVSGFGVLCTPDFLTNIGKIGPFLFEKDHCQRSPLWQLLILYGFFYFWAISFIVFKFKVQSSKVFRILDFNNLKLIKNFKVKIKNLPASDLFILILIALSTFLIILPEFIYAKDIYPAHYRANTMFKLVYQSFMMLSISSAYIIIRIIPEIKRKIFKIFNFYFVYLIFAILFFILVMIYPQFAISSYYGDLFKNDKKLTLDGTVYLKNLYPADFDAILWLNQNIKNQPVILEAQGDSYTDFARVSANTGLPTVLGWTVHEWLWRGTYDVPAPRIPDVQTLYETESLSTAKNLIKKYKVKYVFVGDLERQKYTKLFDSKFKMLGTIVYQSGQTTIYKIDR